MNLSKKKNLAIKTLGVGRDRIVFNTSRLDEIKEAITKQDIRDLVQSGAISVREIKGRRKIVKSHSRRRAGSVKKKVKLGKKTYIIITRSLRSYIKELRKHGKMTKEKYCEIRKQIKSRAFRDKSHLKERLAGVK